MTIASTARKAGPLLGNGSTTSFSFSFKVFATSDIKVAIANSAGVETVLVENTHYTVSLNANQETSPGGAITYPISGSPLPSGSVLSIIGDLDYDQPLDLPSGGNFNPTALENQLDRTVMQVQQLKEQVDRSAKLPQTSAAGAESLVADIIRLADSADNLDTVAGSITGVNTTATNIANVNTVAGSIANVNATGGSIANVNTVATNIASVNTNAANISAIQGAAANAVTATTKAAEAASSASEAFGYLQAYRATSYGALATDPAVDPNGNPPTVGDEYFNTSMNLLKRFNGVTWQASDIATADLAATGGSALVGFQQAGVGAVSTTVQSKMRDVVSVLDFGAIGNGVADDTAAIQAAVNAALCIDFVGPQYSYKVNGTVVLRNGQRLFGQGATITQVATRTQIFDASSRANVEIKGFNAVGVGSDFNNSAGSRADFIYANAASRLVLADNTFTNFSHSALTAVASTDVQFLNNTVVGMGAPTLTPIISGGCVGVVIDLDCDGAIVDGNSITQVSIGVQTGDRCSNVRITNNNLFSIVGQHGVYCGGGQTNLVVSNNTIQDTSLIGIKIQQYDTPARDTRNVSIVGNTIRTTAIGGDGIALLSTDAAPTRLIYNVTVSGNAVQSVGQDGISIKDVRYGIVSGNVVNGTAREGISHSKNTGVQIKDNTIFGAGNSGIREVLATSYCSIVGNTIIDPAVNSTAGQRFGVFITTGSELLVADNVVIDTQAKMQYGFFIEGGTQTTFTFRDNYTAGAYQQGLRTVVATAFRYYSGNVMTGTLGDTTGTTNVNQRGDLRVFYSTAVPASGSWLVGDYVRNSNPVVGQPKGWYCTVAGTPGTWVSEGNL